MTTPDTYPKPTPEQVDSHMAEVRAVLAEARERFDEKRREEFVKLKRKGSA